MNGERVYKYNEGLQILAFQIENKAYLFQLKWNFAYSSLPWSSLMRDKFLHSKYVKIRAHQSSSIWPMFKNFYIIILKITFWTIGQGNRVNFWNDI